MSAPSASDAGDGRRREDGRDRDEPGPPAHAPTQQAGEQEPGEWQGQHGQQGHGLLARSLPEMQRLLGRLRPEDAHVAGYARIRADASMGRVPRAVRSGRSLAHRRVLVDERRPPIAVDGDDDGQAHRGLAGGHGDDEEGDRGGLLRQLPA